MGVIVGVGGGSYAFGEVTHILRQIVRLSGKNAPRLLFLPTAGHDEDDGDDPIRDIFRACGCEVDTLKLSKEPLSEDALRERILGADVVYAGGGDLKFLMDTWTATGADRLLREAFSRGTVLSGYSSGAMCWFDLGWDDCGPGHSFIFVKGMGLLPGCCCPHFDSDVWHTFTRIVPESGTDGVAIDSRAAFVWRDGVYKTISGPDGETVWTMRKDEQWRLKPLA